MIVYHYLNREYGLQSIQKRRLRISIVHLLKDPFEHRAILLPDHVWPAFEKMLEDMSKPDQSRPHGQGIICFSETSESPVMWSMYADNHEGVCLGFEIPDVHLYPVIYVEERIQPPMTMQSMQALLMHKFNDWQYERERRLPISLLEEAREGKHYFAFYEPKMALRSVAVGFRSAITCGEVTALLGDDAKKVDVFRVQRSATTFAMVRDDRHDAWKTRSPTA